MLCCHLRLAINCYINHNLKAIVKWMSYVTAEHCGKPTCRDVVVLSSILRCDHRPHVSTAQRREVTLIPVELSNLLRAGHHLVKHRNRKKKLFLDLRIEARVLLYRQILNRALEGSQTVKRGKITEIENACTHFHMCKNVLQGNFFIHMNRHSEANHSGCTTYCMVIWPALFTDRFL